MKARRYAAIMSALVLAICLLFLFLSMAQSNASIPAPSSVATASGENPTVTAVEPDSAPNDLDTPVVLTGTGFAVVLSDTQVVTSPTAYLGDTALEEVIWVNTTTLSAIVPWGLEPGIYTLTVVNPDGGNGSLPNAFTVTQGIGVWTTGGPYGGHISQIKIHPNVPSKVYAIAFQIGLLASEDAAASWQPMLFNLNPPGQVTLDAQDPNVIYAGTANSFMRSTDGGSTWQQIDIYGIPGMGWEHYMVAHPSQGGTVYAATRGSATPGQRGDVFRSDDYGESWITLTIGLTDTQFTCLAIHPVLTETLLAGTESGNLYYSLDGGQTWTLTTQISNTVSGLYFNPYQPLEAWATAPQEAGGVPYLYKSTDLTTWMPITVDDSLTWGQDGWRFAFLTDTIWAASVGVYTSTDGGMSWSRVAGLPYSGLSIDIHPDRPYDIYVGDFTDGVYKSTDGGATWQQASEGLAGLNPSTVLVAPDNPQTVYAKIDPGLVNSEDGGRTWRSLHFGRGGFPDRTKLAIDPFVSGRLYFGGQCSDSACLWISDDAGQNWTLVTATLPFTYSGWNGAFYTLAPHPRVPGRIMAGVEVWPPGFSFWQGRTEGLFYASDDYGLHWAHLGPTQPISWVTEIAFDSQDPDLIYAATCGTGLWKSTDGGNSWAVTPNPSGIANIIAVATHPELSGTVYVNAHEEGTPDSGLFVSWDAGATWAHLTWQVSDQLLFAPTHPPTLLTGCGWGNEFGAGVCRSLDGGQTWEQVEGISFPTAMATGTDGERVIVYVATRGGMVSPATGMLNPERGNGGTTLQQYRALGAGVYRLTMILPTKRLYLPLVSRGFVP